ncbi:MAG: hypothetical protein GQ574_10160 [Crocinitomix sp.]|nr:hypothetical protein [Crocinitomix sp.]
MKMTQCQIGKVALIDNDIIMVDIESGTEIGIEHIYEFQNAAIDLVNAHKKLYSIVSYGAYSMPTKEAREFCGRDRFNDKYILGRAIVVHGLGQMIITRHTLKQRKSKVPTRIFSDAKNAKIWVNNLRSKNNDYQLIHDVI